MAQRLEWIRLAPQAWAHWEPLRGGLAVQPLLEQRYPQAECLLVEALAARLAAVAMSFAELTASLPVLVSFMAPPCSAAQRTVQWMTLSGVAAAG